MRNKAGGTNQVKSTGHDKSDGVFQTEQTRQNQLTETNQSKQTRRDKSDKANQTEESRPDRTKQANQTRRIHPGIIIQTRRNKTDRTNQTELPNWNHSKKTAHVESWELGKLKEFMVQYIPGSLFELAQLSRTGNQNGRKSKAKSPAWQSSMAIWYGYLVWRYGYNAACPSLWRARKPNLFYNHTG